VILEARLQDYDRAPRQADKTNVVDKARDIVVARTAYQ